MNLEEARKKMENIFGEFALALQKLKNNFNQSSKEDFRNNLKTITNLYLGQIKSIARELSFSEEVFSEEEQEKIVLTELCRQMQLVVPVDFPYLFAIFVSKNPGCRFGWIERRGKLANVNSCSLIVIWVKIQLI